MKIHRFYLESAIFNPHTGAELTIDLKNDRLIHQWRDIFRYGSGDRVSLFNHKSGQWLAEFISLDKKNGAALRIIEQEKVSARVEPKRKVVLYMAIIKNSNFDLVVEKATELGVSEIVPIQTNRTIKSGLNFERLNKLAIEASEQSGRIDIPEILEIMNFEDALSHAILNHATSNFDKENIYFGHISDEEFVGMEVGTVMGGEVGVVQNGEVGADAGAEMIASAGSGANFATKNSESVALFIGPEGGWTDKEIQAFVDAGVKPLSLGQFVLRAETAAIVGVSKLG